MFPYRHTHQALETHESCRGPQTVGDCFETMGASLTSSRLRLSGGEQAVRHRAVCNRGHDVTPSATRFKDRETHDERVPLLAVIIMTVAFAGRNWGGAPTGSFRKFDVAQALSLLSRDSSRLFMRYRSTADIKAVAVSWQNGSEGSRVR
jgi:hypothetical protein